MTGTKLDAVQPLRKRDFEEMYPEVVRATSAYSGRKIMAACFGKTGSAAAVGAVVAAAVAATLVYFASGTGALVGCGMFATVALGFIVVTIVKIYLANKERRTRKEELDNLRNTEVTDGEVLEGLEQLQAAEARAQAIERVYKKGHLEALVNAIYPARVEQQQEVTDTPPKPSRFARLTTLFSRKKQKATTQPKTEERPRYPETAAAVAEFYKNNPNALAVCVADQSLSDKVPHATIFSAMDAERQAEYKRALQNLRDASSDSTSSEE